MRSRKVAGPTLSERISLSQAILRLSVSAIPVRLALPSILSLLADLAFRTGDQPLDIGFVLPPGDDCHDRHDQCNLRLIYEPQHNRDDKSCNQSGQRGLFAELRGCKPDRGEDENHHRRHAEQGADIGGDAFAALETQPDGEEVPQKG